MSIVQRSIVRDLQRVGVITESLDMANGHNRKLVAVPEVCQRVVEYTSYLQYDAPLNARVQCIIIGIITQPTCQTCGELTQMRTSGRFRYTFPTFCSSKCSSNDDITMVKKRLTNTKKYGVANPLLGK